MADQQFWGKDMTTVHDSSSWFGALSLLRKIVFVLLLLFVVAWCFFLGFHVSFARGMERLAEEQFVVTGMDLNEEPYTVQQLEGLRTILIIGCDTREDDPSMGQRSDTMMLAFLNLSEKSVSLLSIPRDSYVQIPGYGKNKINAAFSAGGISLARETVEYLLGIKIDDYVVVDFNGFIELVDALGGIEVNVEYSMSNWNEGIDIYPGLQTLNGHDALGYVRYRGGDVTDYDRIAHQQEFIGLVLDKLLSFSSVTKIAELVGIAINNVETDLTPIEALDLAKYGLTMDLQNMQTYTIEGYSKYIQIGGVYQSCEIIYQDRLQNTLNAIAGEGFSFDTNVIDDGGLGYYTIPEEVEPEEEATGTEGVDQATDSGATPEDDVPTLEDPVTTGQDGGGVWDLPDPDQ